MSAGKKNEKPNEWNETEPSMKTIRESEKLDIIEQRFNSSWIVEHLEDVVVIWKCTKEY